MRIFCSIFVPLLLGIMPPAVEASQYVLATSSNMNRPLQISMRLPADGKSQILYSLIQDSGGITPIKNQVKNPRCGRLALKRNGKGEWITPARCNRVTWTVLPLALPVHGYDANLQSTARIGHASWLVFSERTSLLRIKGESGPDTITMRRANVPLWGGTPVAPGNWRVPTPDEAPEFYVIGNAPTQQIQIGGLSITYVAENAEEVRDRGLLALHAQALSYLTAITFPGHELDDQHEHLLILWLGLDARTQMLNGAAGQRSFIANYVSGGATDETKPIVHALMVTAHEQFHQLTQMARCNLPALPGWLNEALGAYYGITTAKRLLPGTEAETLFARFVDAKRPVEHGLLEWNRRNLAGDASGYPFFYTQGATFLSLLDQTLKAHGSSFDEVMPQLLRSRMPADGSLPPEFISRIRQIAGTEATDLVDHYLGHTEGGATEPPPEKS